MSSHLRLLRLDDVVHFSQRCCRTIEVSALRTRASRLSGFHAAVRHGHGERLRQPGDHSRGSADIPALGRDLTADLEQDTRLGAGGRRQEIHTGSVTADAIFPRSWGKNPHPSAQHCRLRPRSHGERVQNDDARVRCTSLAEICEGSLEATGSSTSLRTREQYVFANRAHSHCCRCSYLALCCRLRSLIPEDDAVNDRTLIGAGYWVGTYVSGPIQELYCDFNSVTATLR